MSLTSSAWETILNAGNLIEINSTKGKYIKPVVFPQSLLYSFKSFIVTSGFAKFYHDAVWFGSW